MDKLLQLEKLKNIYNFDFPLKAKYKHNKNRIYTILDFEDGEEIEFYDMCEKSITSMRGYADYMSKDKGVRLTHINDIESV